MFRRARIYEATDRQERANARARLSQLGAVAAGLWLAVFTQAAWADPKPPPPKPPPKPPPVKPCKPTPDHKPPKKPQPCPVDHARLTTNATDAQLDPLTHEAVIEDVASLVAGPATATGTLTFKVFTDSLCKTTPVGETTVAVHGANGVEYRSGPVSVFAPGVYLWTVTYSGGGSGGGKPVHSGCEAEHEDSVVSELVVDPGFSTNATDAQLDPLTHEAVIEDVASLQGVATATGTLEFKVWADTLCKTTKVGETTVAVHGGAGAEYRSGPVSVSAPGRYFWTVHYTGGGGAGPADSECEATNEDSVVSE